MITFFIAFLEITIGFAKPDYQHSVYNTWKLDRVFIGETEQVAYIPIYLSIEDGVASYETDRNKCYDNSAKITDDYIEIDGICTKVCCDGLIDPIARLLDYSGNYQIRQDTLEIWNAHQVMVFTSITHKTDKNAKVHF